MALLFRNVRVYPSWERDSDLYDIWVQEESISSVLPSRSKGPRLDGEVIEFDGGGRLLSPPLVDPHVHLDSALLLSELPQNSTGTLVEAIQIWNDAKESFSLDSVKDRARRAVLWEVAQGTAFIRSHIDVWDPSLTAVRALLELREDLRDIVDIELIAFPQNGVVSLPEGAELMREAMELGCDVVGGIPHNEWTREDGIDHVRFVFDLARDYGAPVDLHCDETDDEQSRFLEHVAASAIRYSMQGKVVAGHTTAMGSYNDAYAFKLLPILREAGVTIVANPLANIVLQGRFDSYPKRRDLTRVKELDASGVNVACGHDSIMDPCYPLGRGSMLDALYMLVHVAQMTLTSELRRAYSMVTRNPAGAAGLDWTIDPGKVANFVVFDCSDEIEAIRLRPPARWVVRRGRLVAETQPSKTRVLGEDWEEDVKFDASDVAHPNARYR
jgi:cytosine deaminase